MAHRGVKAQVIVMQMVGVVIIQVVVMMGLAVHV